MSTQSLQKPLLPVPDLLWPVDLDRLAELWDLSLSEAADQLKAHLEAGRLVRIESQKIDLWDLPEWPAPDDRSIQNHQAERRQTS